jgi:UDP:flavonoid glycosyltransferase YjiC (YdhE family)
VAEELEIGHATHSYGPIVPGSDFFAAIVSNVLTEADLPDPVPSIFGGPYLDICPPSLQPQGIAPWMTSSPLRPSAGEIGPDDRLPAGFANLPHGRTIYLTLGTIMNQQPDVFRTVLDGCRRHPVNVVTTVGPGVDPADLGTQPANVLVLPYLGQAVLLPHCDAVISHAGAGTMLGALCFGLPQLCLPQGTDQPHNTAALIRTGAGLAISPEDITAEAVADAVGRVLDEPAIRQAAEGIKADIEGMPTPDQAVRTLLEPMAVG